jgi:hypothetical protein
LWIETEVLEAPLSSGAEVLGLAQKKLRWPTLRSQLYLLAQFLGQFLCHRPILTIGKEYKGIKLSTGFCGRSKLSI